jgi:hypothetical protein
MRRLATPAAGLVLLALLTLATGCSAAPPPPRTAPNAVERAALADAQAPAKRDGVPIAPDVWTQLWTPTQAASQIQSCVYRGSGGVLDFEAAPLAQQAPGMRYGVGLSADISALTALGEFDDQRAIGRLVDSCLAVYPIDRRLWLIPESERGALYSYDLTVLRRCLQAHGQQVPRMPSRTRFENLLRANAPWDAYDLVVVTDRAAWYALADACPALPPGMAVG